MCRCGYWYMNKIQFQINNDQVLHFKSQRVDIRVENSIAMIEISQSFVNELETPVEATYKFPTDPDQHTVISRVFFELGDKVVEGKVTEKEKA